MVKVRWLRSLAAVLLCVGCIRSARVGEPSTARSIGAPAASTCEPAAADPPELTSYIDLEIPSRHWIDVKRVDGEWRPLRLPRAPYHHATRLELQDEAAHPELHGEGQRRLWITVESRQMQELSGRAGFHVSYLASVQQVCTP